MAPMTIFALFATLADVAASVIGTAVAGNQFGEVGLVVFGLLTPIETARLFVCDMFCGGSVYLRSVSQSEKNNDKGARLIGFALLVITFVGILMFLGMYFFADVYLSFFSLEPETYELGVSVIRAFAICPLLEMYGYFSYEFAFRMGLKVIPNLQNAISSIGFAILAIICAKQYGIIGMAYANVIAAAIIVALGLGIIIKNKSEIHFKFNIKKEELDELLRYGYSYSQESFYYPIYSTVIYMFIGRQFGESAMAVFTVLECVAELTALFYAVSYAAENQLGTYAGEENYDGIHKNLVASIQLQAIVTVVMMFVFFVFARPIALFMGMEEAYAAETVFAVRIFTCAFPVIALYDFLADFYCAMEKTMACLCLAVSKTLISGIAVTIAFASLFGMTGLYVGKAIEPFVAIVLTHIFSYKVYRNNNLFLLDETKNNIVSFDYDITQDEIMRIRNELENKLVERNISKELILKILLAFEETNLLSLERNKSAIYGECTVFFKENSVDMILRDSGVLFDISNQDASVISLRAYVVANMIAKYKNVSHLNASNTNRVTFSFPLEK